MSEAIELMHRLQSLPRKVSVPFRELLKLEHVSEEVVESVLDAGDLSGDSSRLLAFAVAFMQLRHNGVPIRDVITMAKAQGRRIRLDWSAKRWKAEHDRLSRAAALSRLAQESVTYDISQYEKHVPTQFPGYLIRTSRRLGMEGLRQRNCVASYHAHLASGYCALAVVFVDRIRWTVQLGLTNNAEHPLRISQSRTRLNRIATSEERKAIHSVLGIDDESNRSHSQSLNNRPIDADIPTYLEALRVILPVLRGQGVGEVTVNFDGSGDSGSIESVNYDAENFDSRALHVTLSVPGHEHVDGRWLVFVNQREMNIDEAITFLTEQYLETSGVDWYNNDGGFGVLEIDVDEGTVELNIECRYTQCSSEFAERLDIETGEEL